jgi:hypothetical protein
LPTFLSPATAQELIIPGPTGLLSCRTQKERTGSFYTVSVVLRKLSNFSENCLEGRNLFRT